MSEENSMDSISIAEDEDDIVKDNVAVTHEEESRWRSVADLKMEKMSLKRMVTSLRRGLFDAVRDRAITADAAAIDFEFVQMAASEVIVVLEQLMEIYKARGEVKNLNSSITEIEELETRMSTLEVMVEELDFQAWSEQARSGTGSGRGSPAIDMSTLTVRNASVAPATHSVLVASNSSSSGLRELGSSTGSVVPTIKFEPGTTLTSSSVQNAVGMSKPVSKPAGNMVRTPQTTSVAVTAASAPTVGCSGVPGNAVHMPQAPSVAATVTAFAPRVTAQQHVTNSYSTLPGLPAPLPYQPHQQPMLTHQPRQQHYQQPYQPSYPGPPPPSVMSQQNSWNPGPTANTYTCNEVVFAYLCSCCGFFDDLYLPWVACKCACHDALCVCRMFGLYICLPIVYHNFRCLRLRMRASCIPLSFSCTAYNNLGSSSAFCFLVGLVLK